jgi:hypothetical protein
VKIERGVHDADGFIAVEWVAAVTLLLLPVVMLVGTLPAWAERRHVATIAAREASRALVRDWPANNETAAKMAAAFVAADHGVDPDDIQVEIAGGGGGRGSVVVVRVRIVMPAIAVPAGPRVRGWRYTATSVRRVDDYRSR